MSGLLTYTVGNRVVSADVGYNIRQAGVQEYLTDAQVAAATSVDDLIADVEGAVVSPGAEAPAQRLTIAKALRIGANLGDLSDARIQGASTVEDLANLTWVSVDSATGHLGPGIYG